jgi:hypothetical protein
MTINTLDSFSRVVLSFFEDIDTPLSLGLYLRIKHGMWREAIAISVSPSSYLHHASYLSDASCTAFLRKCAGLPTGVDTRSAAIEKWRQGERDCYHSNQRLVRYLPQFRNCEDVDPRISFFLMRVKKRITEWIGTAPPSQLEGRFGPGATSTDRGRQTTVAHKIANVPSLTQGAIPILPFWGRTLWGRRNAYHSGELNLVRGNRFLTVPKTALTDRCIAAEPSINVFYQLALGRILRKRLKKSTTLDLDYAQDNHRRLARLSSIDNSLATIDLSNASDTVSRVLVKLLVPHTWHEYLEAFRSPFTTIEGKCILLEKFSSMGNGYTFELETILFLAISCQIFSDVKQREPLIGVDVSCFGDDIIISDDLAPVLRSVLKFLGFTVNDQKSFSGSSYFRESCGADFFKGHNVRPFFCKEIPHEPQHWITVANGIKAVKDLVDPFGIDQPFDSWFRALEELPTRIRRLRGPKALGDLCIHDEQPRWNSRWRHSVRWFRVYQPARIFRYGWERFDSETHLACAVYGVGDGKLGITPRNPVLSYRIGWVPYS